MFPTTQKKLENYLLKLGASPQKKWGQNFLLDVDHHLKIKTEANLSKEDVVLEIGAGLGHLTQFLQPHPSKLFIVEIDPIMVYALESAFKQFENVEIMTADILEKKKKLNSEVIDKITNNLNGKNFKVIANLPYNISAPVIVNFLSGTLQPSLMILMVQKEIANRLASVPGKKTYGPLTIQAQLYGDIKLINYVPSKAFFPEPKVISAIIKVTPHNKYLEKIDDLSFFNTIVRATFCLRRKKISNSLRNGANLPKFSKKTLEFLATKFDLSRRPETFSIDEFTEMSNLLGKMKDE